MHRLLAYTLREVAVMRQTVHPGQHLQYLHEVGAAWARGQAELTRLLRQGIAGTREQADRSPFGQGYVVSQRRCRCNGQLDGRFGKAACRVVAPAEVEEDVTAVVETVRQEMHDEREKRTSGRN